MSKELSMITILYKISQNNEDKILKKLWLLYLNNNYSGDKKKILELINAKFNTFEDTDKKELLEYLDLYSKVRKILTYNFAWIEGYTEDFIIKLKIILDALNILYEYNERIIKRYVN